jgi:hypothetical protein
MANRALCVAALEKEKKNLLEKQSSHGAALPVLNRLKNELNGNINSLSNSELEKLLWWKGIPVSKMGKHAERKVLYKRIVEEGGDINVDGLGPRQTWTDANEEELEALTNDPIEMGDNAYAQFEAEKKRDLVWTYRKMNPEERAQLLQDCDEMGTNADESAPPSATPV